VSPRIANEELLTELQQLAEELGETPTVTQVQDKGEYSSSTYQRRFGSFKDALQAADLTPNRFDKASRTELEEEMRRVAEVVGHAPTKKEMNEIGRISERTYLREYDGWLSAREAAGLSGRLEQPNKRNSIDELLSALLELAEDLGRTPKARDMDHYGDHAIQTYQNRFGSWNEALREAGLEVVFDPNTAEFEPYYGENWLVQREKALERDDYECRVCGLTNEKHQAAHDQSLHVHHIQPLRTFDEAEEANNIENLVVLCQSCHKQWEGIPLQPERKRTGED